MNTGVFVLLQMKTLQKSLCVNINYAGSNRNMVPNLCVMERICAV